MNENIAQRIMEASARYMDDDAFIAVFSPDGLAATHSWHCEDDWIVEYTREKVRGGRLAGYWCIFLYKPVGKGSRAQKRGSAREWERVKVERCKTRKEQKQRREMYYWQHNPTRAKKYGKNMTKEEQQ